MTETGTEGMDSPRLTIVHGILALVRRAVREIQEAIEATPPASAEWCIAGEILGAVPIRIKEVDGPQNTGAQ
ncbi:hypothetical protein ACIQC5_11955 [Paenarthrobacter sp. NPDC092416]|uniref:hypothetical protein n=1 Tax=Paenarthrobacter sp. NPDC092416 TaxID=3364386 RepID=UPI00382A5099